MQIVRSHTARIALLGALLRALLRGFVRLIPALTAREGRDYCSTLAVCSNALHGANRRPWARMAAAFLIRASDLGPARTMRLCGVNAASSLGGCPPSPCDLLAASGGVSSVFH